MRFVRSAVRFIRGGCREHGRTTWRRCSVLTPLPQTCGITRVAAGGGGMERAEALASLVSTARSCMIHRSRTPSVRLIWHTGCPHYLNDFVGFRGEIGRRASCTRRSASSEAPERTVLVTGFGAGAPSVGQFGSRRAPRCAGGCGGPRWNARGRHHVASACGPARQDRARGQSCRRPQPNVRCS
jgi:hypothetical protein